MKVLIVEDEKALAEVMRAEFEDADVQTEVAFDGEEAMTKLHAQKPDLLLLDLLLPKKDGFSILEDMKADPKLQRIPTIVISNLGQDEEIKRALSLGAVDYFVKAQHPLKEIVEKVKSYLLQPPAPRKRA